MLYQSPTDQAWLGLWVSIYGTDSMLAKYLKQPMMVPHVDRAIPLQPRYPAVARPPRQARPPGPRRAPPVEKAPRRERAPKEIERRERRVARDIERVTRMPVSDWARHIVGDARISGITLHDILDGIEDYFKIFEQMRRQNPSAYAYFSRIGAPIILRNTKAWEGHLFAPRIANATALPSYFGAFIAHTDEEYRDKIISDHGWLSEFEMFERPGNHHTVAPPGTTIFTHQLYSLNRNGLFTKEELQQFPHARRNWGSWWYVGVTADGDVRALPCRMSRQQRLPNGEWVRHSSFTIPPGLAKWGEESNLEDKTAHGIVRISFNIVVAFATSATAGVQVTIKKDRRRARFGVPVSALKNFFADREPGDSGRRKALMHLRLGHDRHMADGRIIQVGEHLSGERFFTWRGYEVMVGVPGIHYPAPEGYANPVYTQGDPDAPLPPEFDLKDFAPIGRAGAEFAKHIWDPRRVPFRRGEPTERRHQSGLPQAFTPESPDE